MIIDQLISLQDAKVPVENLEFSESKLLNVQSSLVLMLLSLTIDFSFLATFLHIHSNCWLLSQEKLVTNNYYLNKSAKDAYRSYMLAYSSHASKDIFNVHRLDVKVIFLLIYRISNIYLVIRVA